jgi:lambda family phage minor tail protein L
MAIIADLQSLNSSPMVELFALTNYSATNPGEYFRFTGWRACNWLGVNWDHLDVQTSNFASDGRALPKPRIKVSNEITGPIGSIGALAAVYGDLLGATLFRYRTLEQYLQINSSEMVLTEEFQIQQKSGHDKNHIEWELSALDLENIELPRRNFQNTYCSWQYRGDGCFYSGGAVATINDVPTNDLALDDCGRNPGSCRIRFGESAELPIDVFLGLN